jgi:hypothetical protein
MTTYTATKPLQHVVVKKYGCCKGCGLFHFNTTSWVKNNQDFYDDSHLSTAEFGPFEAEIGLREHTKIKNEVRSCVNSAQPLSSWEYMEFPN